VFKKTKLLSILSISIVMVMIFSMVSLADTAENISSTQTDEWVNKGWKRLHKEQEFQPDKNLTRAEVVALVNSLLNFKEEGEIDFSDVPADSQYYREVCRASKAGYIIGRGGGIFDPEGEISRAEICIIISRILELDLDSQPDEVLQFKDADDVPRWAVGAVESLVQRGLRKGKNKIKALESLTGSEVVELLEQFFVETEVPETDGPKKEEEPVEPKEEGSAVQEEGKGGGKSPLSFKGAFLASIEGDKSTELGGLEDGYEGGDTVIKLVFDRGIVREHWDNNQQQIKLQANNGSIIESEVFRIEGADAEKSHIFIRPLEELKSGKTVNIVIGEGLMANNGNTLGKEEIVKFSIK